MGTVQVTEEWRTPLTNLLTLPAFVLDHAGHRLLGWTRIGVSWRVGRDSDYVGLSVVALVRAAGWTIRRKPPRSVRAL